MECDILIKNADWVITMDNLRRIIRNGSIAIEKRDVHEIMTF